MSEEVFDATQSIGVVQPINRAYYVLNTLIDLRDELRAGAVSKRDMMAYSDSVKKRRTLAAPKWARSTLSCAS